jgi:hypothetical protein
MTDFTVINDSELLEAILVAEEQAAVQARLAKAAREEFLHRKRNAIAEAYATKENQFGVIHLEEGEYKLDITISAKVEWNQAKLAALEAEIREQWKADPAEYIDSKLTVKESKYKAWPSDLKLKFEPARTVKASAASLAITIKDKE